MKRNLGIFLSLCMILSLVIGSSSVMAADDGYVIGNSGKFTVEEAADRISAYQECQNLAGLHEFYHTALDHQGELDNCWVTEDQYKETMSWTNNTQFMYGYDNVWDFYCGPALTGHAQSTQSQAMAVDSKGLITMDDEWYGTGTLWYHMLMSPVIEVARDGQTAVGLWQSFGTVTEVSMCQWTCEDYTMVFVKQSDGQWRIWHLRTFVHFYTTYGNNWYEQNMATQGMSGGGFPEGYEEMAANSVKGEGESEGGMMPPGGESDGGESPEGESPAMEMPQMGQEEYSINGTYYVGLDLYKVPVLATIPKPYDTWDDIKDTFAWGGFQPLLGKNALHMDLEETAPADVPEAEPAAEGDVTWESYIEFLWSCFKDTAPEPDNLRALLDSTPDWAAIEADIESGPWYKFFGEDYYNATTWEEFVSNGGTGTFNADYIDDAGGGGSPEGESPAGESPEGESPAEEAAVEEAAIEEAPATGPDQVVDGVRLEDLDMSEYTFEELVAMGFDMTPPGGDMTPPGDMAPPEN